MVRVALTLCGFLFTRFSKLPCSFVWPAGKILGDTSLSVASTFSNTTCQTVVITARSCSTMTRAPWTFESVEYFFLKVMTGI